MKNITLDEEYRRFKQIREELNLTQSAFAEELGIGATTADIERGRTRIPGYVVKELLRKYQVNPMWLFGESNQKYLQTDKIAVDPKVITINPAGSENIVLVNAQRMYVVVTADSVLVKKVRKETDSSVVNLISLNPEYLPIQLDRNDIREVWTVNSKLTFDLENHQTVSLLSIHQEMKALREDMKSLARK